MYGIRIHQFRYVHLKDHCQRLLFFFYSEFFLQGIASISFSTSGDRLAAVSIDPNHEIAVFDITAKSKLGGVILCKEKGGLETIQEVKWKNDNVNFLKDLLKFFSKKSIFFN